MIFHPDYTCRLNIMCMTPTMFLPWVPMNVRTSSVVAEKGKPRMRRHVVCPTRALLRSASYDDEEDGGDMVVEEEAEEEEEEGRTNDSSILNCSELRPNE